MVVGDGPARPEVEERARLTNSTCGREVVTLTGELLDPRPAYALADVLLGMGSSVLRGMAFEKAAVVQGEAGFWSVASPATLPMFLRQGWYGLGDGSPGVARLTQTLLDLLSDERARRELGAFSRRVVRDRFSLERAAVLQEAVYEEALARRYEAGRAAAMTRASAGLVAYKVRRRYDRLRGQAAVDDFNARRVQPAVPKRAPA
jgi:glycosyltransferase involved in cell wall biosynthesis